MLRRIFLIQTDQETKFEVSIAPHEKDEKVLGAHNCETKTGQMTASPTANSNPRENGGGFRSL